MGETNKTDRPINVFFDATSLIKVGAPPGNETFLRLVDLVQYGFITVVTTDLTKTEIVRHHTNVAFNILRPLVESRFRRLVAQHFNVGIPEMSQGEVRQKVKDQIANGVERMFFSLRATVLDINEVRPSVIFADYDQNEGFFVAHNKKNQFPDAFIFERLKSVASADTPLLVVTDDSDFLEPSSREDYIDVVDSIPELFGALGLLVDEPHPNLEPILYDNLMDNPDFLVYVESDDWQMEEGCKVTTICHTIEFDRALLHEYW